MDTTFKLDKTVFNYRVAAVLIVNNHVLIHKQVKDDHWALPGGRAKVMEDSPTSIKREIKEELGFEVKINRLLWITENFFKYNSNDFHEIALYYNVSLMNNDYQLNNNPFYGEEGDRLIYQWIPIQDLENYLLYPEFLRVSIKHLSESVEHVILGKS
ncbi:NUDIX hydrolase [Aquibacillus kalidii]|uniref:NUDIX hydrolase n=1 Tax=Aquibacillus kalidii TaxID=2762597 RepID=UPI0016462879|nr:NUDIX hydrolase [Aquibacillus kalidii]